MAGKEFEYNIIAGGLGGGGQCDENGCHKAPSRVSRAMRGIMYQGKEILSVFSNFGVQVSSAVIINDGWIDSYDVVLPLNHIHQSIHSCYFDPIHNRI